MSGTYLIETPDWREWHKTEPAFRLPEHSAVIDISLYYYWADLIANGFARESPSRAFEFGRCRVRFVGIRERFDDLMAPKYEISLIDNDGIKKVYHFNDLKYVAKTVAEFNFRKLQAGSFKRCERAALDEIETLLQFIDEYNGKGDRTAIYRKFDAWKAARGPL